MVFIGKEDRRDSPFGLKWEIPARPLLTPFADLCRIDHIWKMGFRLGSKTGLDSTSRIERFQ